MDWDFSGNVSLDLGGVHVRGVLEVSWESVVLADEGIEDIGEVDVGVLISGVDTAVLHNSKRRLRNQNRIDCIAGNGRERFMITVNFSVNIFFFFLSTA